MSPRIEQSSIVLLSGPFPSTAYLYNYLKVDFKIAQVILEPLPSRWEIFKNRVRRQGAGTALGQVAFRTLVAPYLQRSSQRRMREIESEFQLDATAIPESAVQRVSSANAPETISSLQNLHPAVTVVFGTRILTPVTLSSARTAFINLHAGITPLYRGVHGAYWALCQRQKEYCGVTVHRVDNGIDTGGILAQALVAPTEKDNFATYPLLQIAAGLPLLKSAITKILEGHSCNLAPPAGPSHLWTHPTFFEYMRNRVRQGVK
jgi:folate-dependent phosphoribosylglycinamide formyltransferase PurN